MCVVDWSAIAEWLSAVGTIGAVIVALYLAGRDRRDQHIREKHEARIVAMLLGTDLETIRVRAEALAGEVSDDHAGGLMSVLIEMEENIRADIADKASDFPLATIESIVGRLHVLPVEASAALLQLLAAVREVRLAGAALAAMTRTQALRDVSEFVPKLQEQLADLQCKARTAIAACEKVIG